MAEVAANARSYADGHVFTALFNTTLPTDPLASYGAGFTEIGWLSDKGITEARAITSTDKYSWQNSTLIRTLRSQEKRSFTFEALEDNAMVHALMYPTAVATSGSSTNEVQTLTLTATGGTFTVTFNGATTTAQTASASLPTTAALQSALQALPTIGTGNVLVTGTAGSSYVLTFSGALAGTNVNPVTLGIGSLTGGTLTVAQTTAGAPAVTSTPVKPYTGQNLRAWGIDLIDGPITRRLTMANAEAVWSGSRSYLSNDLAVVSFTLTVYPDANGVDYTEYSNDPALASVVS